MAKLGILLFPLLFLTGCGDDDFTPYGESTNPDATILVHARSTDWDIFLDGEHLGRISWSQPYGIPSGAHVLGVQRAGGVPTRADRAELPFSIQPGETIEFDVFIDASGFSRLVLVQE
jgi:hypothetical protein